MSAPGRAERGTFAVITGGGTAGHVLPGLAVGEALVARGHARTCIRFVGARRGHQERALPASGFSVTLLPGRGIIRSLKPSAVLANAGAAAGLGMAFLRAVALLARDRPAVVISVGGYASVPCALAAVLLGVPLLLVNTDAQPGVANRLVGRFARASAVAFEGTRLPRSRVTGTPLRPQIEVVPERSPAERASARLAARIALDLPPELPVVAVVGGSLGARRINEAVAGLVDEWTGSGSPPIAVYHVRGRRAAAETGPRGGERVLYRAVEFEDRMAELYAAADLAVCRAGAVTVAELAAVGLPAVLVPFPGAPGDHQAANARALVDAGGAVLLPDVECTGARLRALIEELLGDRGRLVRMAEAAGTLRRPGAASAVADLVEQVAA